MSIFRVTVIELSLYDDIGTVVIAFRGPLQDAAATRLLGGVRFVGAVCFSVAALRFNYLEKTEKFC